MFYPTANQVSTNTTFFYFEIPYKITSILSSTEYPDWNNQVLQPAPDLVSSNNNFPFLGIFTWKKNNILLF